MKRILVFSLFLSLFLGLAPAFADDVIYAGIDVFTTPDNSETFVDFTEEPIPAGFFCQGSRAFTGKIEFQGVPVVTGEGGVLGDTDTIVERLDDARFDEDGVATTRVQIRALQLASTSPIETDCGTYDVRVALSGRQPVTQMKIIQESAQGGRFLAPIGVNARVIFTPTGGGAALSVAKDVRFPADPRGPWSTKADDAAPQVSGSVQVDTDFDGRVDTQLPGTSNFAAGIRPGTVLTRTPLYHLTPLHSHFLYQSNK